MIVKEYNTFKCQSNVSENDLKTINSLINRLSDTSLDLLIYIIGQAKQNKNINHNEVHMGYFKSAIITNQDLTIEEYKNKSKNKFTEKQEQEQIDLANRQPLFTIDIESLNASVDVDDDMTMDDDVNFTDNLIDLLANNGLAFDKEESKEEKEDKMENHLKLINLAHAAENQSTQSNQSTRGIGSLFGGVYTKYKF